MSQSQSASLRPSARYLVDTNVLLRAADPSCAQHSVAVGAITHLLAAREELCIAPQNLIEFWVVATRPLDVNGLGWTSAQAQMESARLQAAFVLLPDAPSIFGEWQRLATRYGVLGAQAHDCRLVAVMLVHGGPRTF